MFDHRTVHIDDPDHAVRPDGRAHRAEPRIARTQKLRFLFRCVTNRAIGRALVDQLRPVNQVVDRLAYERCSIEPLTECSAANDDRTARRRETIGGEQVVEAVDVAERIDGRSHGRIKQLMFIFGITNSRISFQIPILDGKMIHRATVVAAKPIAPIVATADILGPPADGR